MKLNERAGKLKTDIPAAFLAIKRKDTPPLAKILAGFTVAYALSPIDLIPDFIPVLGLIDDLILLPLLITATFKLIPKNILDECRVQSAGMWNNRKPTKWIYALPIIVFWLLIVYAIVKSIGGAK
jgi:uncharacterized membrane protein YkvA (DUF1232 family)